MPVWRKRGRVFPLPPAKKLCPSSQILLAQLCQSELNRSTTNSTGENGHFLFLNRKIVNPTRKNTKHKLFAVSGVLVEFRTQGNGRFASANWNFQFQFFHIRNKMFKILVPYSTLRSFLNSLPAFLDFGSAFFENFGFVLGYPMNFECSYFHIDYLFPPHHIHVTFPA